MEWAILGLVVALVGLVIAAAVWVARLKDEVRDATVARMNGETARAYFEARYKDQLVQAQRLDETVKELRDELAEIETELGDGAVRDPSGLAARMRERLSSKGVRAAGG
jgi:Tfp pilus assembly protein PilO